jgi:hypothetical protein
MDAGVNVTILKLHAKAEWKSLGRLLQLTDDTDTVLYISHVVVGHLVNEEWPPVEIPHLFLLFSWI